MSKTTRDALSEWRALVDEYALYRDTEYANAYPITRWETAAARLVAEVEWLASEVARYEAWERCVNEALNSGDGAYRP